MRLQHAIHGICRMVEKAFPKSHANFGIAHRKMPPPRLVASLLLLAAMSIDHLATAIPPPKTLPNLDPSCECGTRAIDTRILNGQEVENALSNPWLVLLKAYNGQYTIRICAGTIINSRWILTAAHCVVFLHSNDRVITALPENVEVRIGGITAWQKKVRFGIRGIFLKTMKSKRVDKIIVHKKYDILRKDKFSENDITLLRLSEELKFEPSIRPACLPSVDMNVFGTSSLHFAGWGATSYEPLIYPDKLHTIDTKELPYNVCYASPRELPRSSGEEQDLYFHRHGQHGRRRLGRWTHVPQGWALLRCGRRLGGRAVSKWSLVSHSRHDLPRLDREARRQRQVLSQSRLRQ